VYWETGGGVLGTGGFGMVECLMQMEKMLLKKMGVEVLSWGQERHHVHLEASTLPKNPFPLGCECPHTTETTTSAGPWERNYDPGKKKNG